MRLAALSFWIVLPAIARAVEQHPVHEEHAFPWLSLIFSTINLLIFLAILKRFAWPAVRSWTKDRSRSVVATLQQAALAKREAEELKARWQERMAGLGGELEALRQQAREEIERERQQMLDAARQAAEAIRRDAERATAQEVRDAQSRLRVEVAQQALGLARNMAKQRLTAADHERFVGEFLSKV